MKLFVDWEYTWGSGGICEGDEDKDHKINYVSLHRSLRSDTVEVDFDPTPGDDVFVVAVTYSTGSTFGQSFGEIEIVDVCETRAAANELTKFINDGTYGKDENGYVPWEGYFENLETADVHKFSLEA